MKENIPFITITMICSFIFIAIGVSSIMKKTPMNFWSGTKVKSEEISDIRGYNRANGIMWIIYGLSYVLAELVSVFFGSSIGAIFVSLSATLGLGVLVIRYGRIYKKYRVK